MVLLTNIWFLFFTDITICNTSVIFWVIFVFVFIFFRIFAAINEHDKLKQMKDSMKKHIYYILLLTTVLMAACTQVDAPVSDDSQTPQMAADPGQGCPQRGLRWRQVCEESAAITQDDEFRLGAHRASRPVLRRWPHHTVALRRAAMTFFLRVGVLHLRKCYIP